MGLAAVPGALTGCSRDPHPPHAVALTPILPNVPLQLLAYHIAVLRGTNVDQPRTLPRSVTVK